MSPATNLTEEKINTMSIKKESIIQASPEIVWESILEELVSFGDDKGNPLHFKFEPHPGGRWFRDLGNDTGHLWGHVQVIKPPKVLEIYGPMFMSYPVASHIQYKLAPEGKGATKLNFSHRAFGLIDPEHAAGVSEGWGMMIDAIAKIAQRRAGK